MAYTDIQELEGIFANACLQHGPFSDYEPSVRRRWYNPYTDVALTPDGQHRLQAYKKAIESIRNATAVYYVQGREAWIWQPLSVARIESSLAHLEDAAASGNEAAFTHALTQVDWNGRPAEDYIRGIDLALQVGAHIAARKLALEGAEFHFDSEELQKYARVLAPPQVLRTSAPQIEVMANVQWLKANKNEYKGKWVAIKNGKLIASADSHDELIAEIGETKGRSILVTHLY